MSWKLSGIVKGLTTTPDGRKLTANEKLFLLILADYSSEATGTSWPSVQRLAAECLCSDRTLQKMIGRMVRAGFIEVDRRLGFTNRYTLKLEQSRNLFTPEDSAPQKQLRHPTPEAAASPEPSSEPSTREKTILLTQLPTWIPPAPWNAYLEMRKRIKKPLFTTRGFAKAINTLEKLAKEGNDPEEVLDQSTFNCWQGLFPIREDWKQKHAAADVGKFDPERKVPDYSADIAEILKRHPDLA